MAREVQVTIDCSDPARLAAFWASALDCVVQPPPGGFGTWEEALDAWGVPAEHRNDRSAVVDPAGAGPRIFFQRVPEPKTVKNRVHLDIRVGEANRDAELARLTAAGATVLHRGRQGPHTWVTITDPEGNELCLA
jgi:hypothetical protein